MIVFLIQYKYTIVKVPEFCWFSFTPKTLFQKWLGRAFIEVKGHITIKSKDYEEFW